MPTPKADKGVPSAEWVITKLRLTATEVQLGVIGAGITAELPGAAFPSYLCGVGWADRTDPPRVPRGVDSFLNTTGGVTGMAITATTVGG